MHPTLVTLDLGSRHVPIGGYGACVCVAIALAALVVLRAGRRAGSDAGACVALIGWALAAGFAGALLLHAVVQVWRGQPLALALAQPGLASFGALLGVCGAVHWGARALGLSALAISDRAAVGLLCAQAVGRVGCFLGGCCFGRTWGGPLAVHYPPAFATPAASALGRHPVPLYEAGALLALAAWLAMRRDAQPGSGQRTRSCLLLYCLLRIAIESLRADDIRGTMLAGALSCTQLIAAALLLCWALFRSMRPRWAAFARGSLRLWPLGLALLMPWVALRAAAERTQRLGFVAPNRVAIPAGWLAMGSDAEDLAFALSLCQALSNQPKCSAAQFADEQPRHRVYVSAFRLDRTEVSREQYARCVQLGRCDPARPDASSAPHQKLPVSGVSVSDAQRYCAAVGGRLPSEAEWERAARGDTTRRFPWGNAWNPHLGRAAARAPVPLAWASEYADGASVFGVLQMAGNVWELTADRYDATYYAHSERIDPHNGVGNLQAMRGGSSHSPGYTLRVTQRAGINPAEGKPDVGFRCAYDIP